MRAIKQAIDKIKDEVKGANKYAQEYLELKMSGSPRAKAYYEMAQQELTHALTLHEFAVKDIEEIRKTYTPPQGMLDMWEREHGKIINKVAWIKQILNM